MCSASVVARPRWRSWVDMFHVKRCFAYGCICNYYICNLFTVHHHHHGCLLGVHFLYRWLGITTVILLPCQKYWLRFSWMGYGGSDDGRCGFGASERGLRPAPPLAWRVLCLPRSDGARAPFHPPAPATARTLCFR